MHPTGTALDLEEVPTMRRAWRFERVGWSAIALLLAAGLAGLFGDGMLAAATVASDDGSTVVQFERIVRHGAPTQIQLQLAPSSAGTDTLIVLSLDDRYLDAVDVSRITPEPIRVRALAGGVEYQLLRGAPTERMTITLAVQPRAPGVRRAGLGTSHGTILLRQFVLP